MDGTINNTNVERNGTITIINTNLEPIIERANNDTDDEVDLEASGTLGAWCTTIQDIDAWLSSGGFNNDIDNEFDVGVLDMLNTAIKDTDAKPTTDIADNNTDVEVNASMYICRSISNTDTDLTLGEWNKANTIIEKEIC